MKLIVKTLALIVVSTVFAFGQRAPRVTSGIDIGTGYLDGEWVPAVTYHQDLSLNNFPWLRVGWGVRAWGYYAGRTDLLPQTNKTSRDMIQMGKVTANGVSFLVGANFRLWRVDLGANTDLVGIAFGLKRKAYYSTDFPVDTDDAGNYNTHVPATPAMFNALPLALDKQNGQSELYLRYWITERIGVKLGYSYGRITYMTSDKLNGENRFSKMYGFPFAAIAFPLYN